MNAPAPDRNRVLMREIRRGVLVQAQALFTWARGEADARNATLAVAIAKALMRITDAMAAWNEDGVVRPGDSRLIPRSGNRPPHDFSQ